MRPLIASSIHFEDFFNRFMYEVVSYPNRVKTRLDVIRYQLLVLAKIWL